jgi:outer membrane protein
LKLPDPASFRSEVSGKFPEDVCFKESKTPPMTCKLLRSILPVALISLTALAQTGNAAAAPAASGASKIGIINIQQAIMLTNEGRRDFEALQKKFEPTQNQLNALNQEIENLKKQLQAQGDKLNEEARAAQVKNIETKQKSLQRQVEDAQGDFQNQQSEIANRIGGKMMDVMDKYAKANGYLTIFDISNPQTPVLWFSPSTDVTKEMVDAYNAQSGVAAPPAPSASAPKPATRPAVPAAAKPPAPKQ